jgi:hypothetical protein
VKLRRFRLLQRDVPGESGANEGEPRARRGRMRRKLEREGEVLLGARGAAAPVHFCPRCESENPAVPACTRCGAPLEGPGQAAFDRALRRERAAAAAAAAQDVPRPSRTPRATPAVRASDRRSTLYDLLARARRWLARARD